MFKLPDLNVTGFESKAYIRYYTSCLFFSFTCIQPLTVHIALTKQKTVFTSFPAHSLTKMPNYF